MACRLTFDCTPVGTLFGIGVNGRRVKFDEHVFYRFARGKIFELRSVIEKAAIAGQLA